MRWDGDALFQPLENPFYFQEAETSLTFVSFSS